MKPFFLRFMDHGSEIVDKILVTAYEISTLLKNSCEISLFSVLCWFISCEMTVLAISKRQLSVNE